MNQQNQTQRKYRVFIPGKVKKFNSSVLSKGTQEESETSRLRGKYGKNRQQ